MRSQIFDESLPIAMVVGLQKRLELMTRQPERRQKLWEITNKLQNGLRELGFNLGKTESAITPIYLPPREDAADSSEADDDQRINPALSMVMDMRENYGIFCTIVKYPVVPQGTLMLRMMPTSSHTLEDVEYTLDTFKKLKEKLNSGAYDNQALLK